MKRKAILLSVLAIFAFASLGFAFAEANITDTFELADEAGNSCTISQLISEFSGGSCCGSSCSYPGKQIINY